MKAKIKIIRPASTISLIIALFSNVVYIPYFMGFDIDFWIIFTIVTVIHCGCVAFGYNNELEPSLIDAEELRSIYVSCKFRHIVNGILHVPLILFLLIPFFVNFREFWHFIRIANFPEHCPFCTLLCFFEILLAVGFYFTEFDINKTKKEIELFEKENTTTYENELKEEKRKIKEAHQQYEQDQALLAQEKKEKEEKYGKDFIEFHKSIVILGKEKQIIEINKHIYKFKEIISYSLVCNDKVIISHTTGESSKSTGTVVGRALLGGALAGGAGAIVAASTAPVNISSNTSSQVERNFVIYVTVDNLDNPLETIHFSNNEYLARRVSSILEVIVKRNNNEA